MVHNGIEYGDMQLCCEAYALMKDVLGMNHDAMSDVRTNYFLFFYSKIIILSNILLE